MTIESGQQINRTLDVRVTSCAGCHRTVTLVGTGIDLADFEWSCPYEDASCALRDVRQVARQIRGPLGEVIAGLIKRSRV